MTLWHHHHTTVNPKYPIDPRYGGIYDAGMSKDPNQRSSIKIDPEVLDAVREYQHDRRIVSTAEAVRQLLRIGLRAAGPAPKKSAARVRR